MLRPAIIVSGIVIALTVLSTIFFTKALSIVVNSILATILVALLLFFMLSTIYSVSKRRLLSVAIFTVVNVGCIIVTFGNIFRYVGIRSTTADLANTYPVFNSIYFSAITWTTVGYGDLVPNHNSRPIAAFEALIGYLIMALMITVLLTIIQSDTYKIQSDVLDKIYKIVRDKLGDVI